MNALKRYLEITIEVQDFNKFISIIKTFPCFILGFSTKNSFVTKEGVRSKKVKVTSVTIGCTSLALLKEFCARKDGFMIKTSRFRSLDDNLSFDCLYMISSLNRKDLLSFEA